MFTTRAACDSIQRSPLDRHTWLFYPNLTDWTNNQSPFERENSFLRFKYDVSENETKHVITANKQSQGGGRVKKENSDWKYTKVRVNWESLSIIRTEQIINYRGCLSYREWARCCQPKKASVTLSLSPLGSWSCIHTNSENTNLNHGFLFFLVHSDDNEQVKKSSWLFGSHLIKNLIIHEVTLFLCDINSIGMLKVNDFAISDSVQVLLSSGWWINIAGWI